MLTAARNASGPRNQRAPPPGCLARLPARIAQDRERNQHEQRQEADALRDHAESGRRPADRVPAPRRTEQQMAQQAVQAERRPETQRRVDLRLPRLPHELHREQQRQRAGEPGLAIPQAAAEVVDQQRRSRAPRATMAAGTRRATNASLAGPARSARRTAAACPAYGSPPTRGSSQSPVATMSRATSAKRGSSAGHGSRRPMPVAISSSASASSHSRSTHHVGTQSLATHRDRLLDRLARAEPSNIR